MGFPVPGHWCILHKEKLQKSVFICMHDQSSESVTAHLTLKISYSTEHKKLNAHKLQANI